MAPRKPKAAAAKPPAKPRKPAAKKAAPRTRKPAAKPAAETEAAPKKPGPAPKHPVDQIAEDIKVMVSCGFEQARIARILKISTATMQKYYRDELEIGADIANFEIGGTIYRNAKKGEKWAASLWAARRLGWSETIQHKGELTVNQVNLVAPDLPMPDEDPNEATGFEDIDDLDPDEFDDEDFGN